MRVFLPDPQNTSDESAISGVIARVTFHNPENGYSVLQVNLTEQNETLTVVGTILNPVQGMSIHARGKSVFHQRFGAQFQAASITEIAPSTNEGIEKYLSSGLIKGIGEKTARRLVNKFAEKTLEIIYKDPDKLATVSGISKNKALLIHNACTQQRANQDSMRFLIEHGVKPNLAQKIVDKYKSKTVEILSKDPYMLARQIKGIGFLTVDRIALQLGITPDSPERLKAGIFYALERSADDGHCYLNKSDLFRRSITLLGIGDHYDLSEHLESLLAEGFVVAKDDSVYLHHIAAAEKFVADFIASRAYSPKQSDIPAHSLMKALKYASQELELDFSEEQRDAVQLAAENSLLLITGGPGCGKTTIIKALCHLFKQSKKRFALAAPTGRAAQRMSQVCDYPAGTIHRLLKYDPRSGKFTYGINDPLQIDALIIDEASMIDILLAKDLFSAIPRNAKLILVGDKDQLPSVGPGKVFSDLITSKGLKSVVLSRLFRRQEESSINDIAFMINSGIVPTIPTPDGLTKVDAYFIPKRDPQEAAATIESLVADQISRKFSIPLPEITVLTPSNRGPLGTVELNRRLQARLNPRGVLGADTELEHGNNVYRLGDRVCQRVNNYQIDPYGVFNGDTGQIHSIERAAKKLTVELWDGRLIKYDSSDIGQLSLAYAVTVHRSQGAEIPCVVLALTDSHFTLLERQLIYTAVTRAKKLLIVVGSKRALEIACKKITTQKRGTSLKQRIEESLKT